MTTLGRFSVDEIYCGDSALLLAELPDDCIDLTVTSPPYDNMRKYKGFAFDFEAIATQLYRVTKQGGVLVWIVGDETVEGSESTTSAEQKIFFRKIGFNIHDTMIYRKSNYIPLTHNRYEQEFEYMFVFSKSSPKVFNPIKRKNALAGKQFNTYRPRDYDGHSIRHNTDRNLTYNQQSIRGNIFDYVVGAGADITNHPATFPEGLPRDHILSWSNAGDIVLDPFMGSGTTAKMAVELGRHYLGFELSQEYVDLGKRRVAGARIPLGLEI